MNGFYKVTQALYQVLKENGFNVITLGDYLKVDLNRQNPLPYVHIVPQGSLLLENTVEFTFAIIGMDLVDFNKDNPREENPFFGVDNLQDVLNDIHNKLNLAVAQFRTEDKYDEFLCSEGDYGLNPFFKRFENLYAGWELSLTIEIPNTDVCINPLAPTPPPSP